MAPAPWVSAEAPWLTVVVQETGDEAALAATLESVRDQGDGAFEILVVALDADSAAASRNGALRLARAPLVAFLSAGDRLVPRALRTVAGALIGHPRSALAYGHAFEVDGAGRVPKLALRQYAGWIKAEVPADLDQRVELIAGHDFAPGTPIYRRDILLAAGGFADAVHGRLDLDMALRLLDDYGVCLVPELVCGRPDGRSRQTWRGLFRSVIAARRLARSGHARFLADPPYRLRRLVLIGAGRRLRGRFLGPAGRAWRRLRLRIRRAPRVLSVDGVATRWVYEAIVGRCRWWPFAWMGERPEHHGRRPPRIAYILWHYPTLSETFIRREVRALRRRAGAAGGAVVDVFADAPDAPDLEPDPPTSQGETVYLHPIPAHRVRRFAKRFFLRHPLRFLNLAVWVATHEYGPHKFLGNDVLLFRKAVYLAGLLDERGVTHLHAPWADTHAFLTRVAARLLDLPYSVQVRAHELHSHTYNIGLEDRLLGARFIVTNSRFNQERLARLLGPARSADLHVIFNGVHLPDFVPDPGPVDRGGSIRLLSVGRLVEQKGFEYLLRACRLLRDRGLAFHCDIIGGPHPDLDANTFVSLKKLRRRLDVADVVSFLGARPFDAVLEAYRTTDILALPCVVSADGGRDVTPNVLLEAMAMRIPVIATPVGAIPEIIDHGVNGWLVPPNDAAALADAIDLLAGDLELRRRLARAAREKIEARFDSDRNVGRYAELFGVCRSPADPGAVS